jgi:Galactose oxidase, central domain
MPSKKFSILLIVMMASAMAACSGLTATSNGNGNGNGGGGNITATIQVTISGLAQGASMILENNGGDALTVTSNGTFSFSTQVTGPTDAYDVTVNTQPITPNQICTVTTPSGTAAATLVALTVSCVNSYTVGGTVTGLVGTGFTLQDQDGNILDTLKVSSANGNQAFQFTDLVPTGSAYNVTITQQPNGPDQTCVIATGTGTGTATQNVTSIAITCPAVTFSVGGTVVGTEGITPNNGVITDSSFVIENVLGNSLIVTQNGPFTFATPEALNDQYQVSVFHQPSTQSQGCTTWDYKGVVTTNITNILVDCGHDDWTWIDGTDSAVTISAPTYGSFPSSPPTTIPNPFTNTPGARYGSASWTDNSGNLWMFGGRGWELGGSSAPDTLDAPMNDVWVCVTGGPLGGLIDYCEWQLVGGYDATYGAGIIAVAQEEGQPDIYSNVGKSWPAPTPAPGGRLGIAVWTDAAGNAWFFGGSNGRQYHNDMWKLNSGAAAYGPPSQYLWTSFTGTAPVWTFLSATTPTTENLDQPGIYPPNTNAYPGARTNAATWKDSSGNFWMFGGYGWDGESPSVLGFLNDLWMYNLGTGKWTYEGGSSTANQLGNYGTPGTAALSNQPGGRHEAVTWVDASGNFWLFGGEGEDSAGTANGILNDMWMYNTGNNQWTFVQSTAANDTTANQTGVYPSVPSVGPPNTTGAAGTFGLTAASSTFFPGSRWGAVGWVDQGGDFWLFGGWGLDSMATDGNGALNDTWVYVPNAAAGQPGTWTWVKGGNTGSQPGIYVPPNYTASITRPYLTHEGNAPGGRSKPASWIDSLGQLWMFGGQGYDGASPTPGNGSLNDMWRYVPYPD